MEHKHNKCSPELADKDKPNANVQSFGSTDLPR